MAIPCFCVRNLIKKPAWKNTQAKACLCYLNLTAADPWQELHLWRAQGSKELDSTNGKTLRKIFSPYLCAQRELPGSYKIHYSDSSQIFCHIIHQWTWPVIAINSALILKTSLPVSIFPGSCGFGYVQWKKPHLTLHDISQIQTLFSPSGVSFCLEGSDHIGMCSGRCSGNQIFTPGTGFLSFWKEPWEWEALPHIAGTPAQCLCQQLAVGVCIKDLSVYIYMNIVDFVIISLQYLHIQLSDWLWGSKQHPRGSQFVQVRHLL